MTQTAKGFFKKELSKYLKEFNRSLFIVIQLINILIYTCFIKSSSASKKENIKFSRPAVEEKP